MSFAVLIAWLAMFCMVCAENPTTSTESEFSMFLTELIGIKERELGNRVGTFNLDPLLTRNSEQYQSKCLALGVQPTDFIWASGHTYDKHLVIKQSDDWIGAMLRDLEVCPVLHHADELPIEYIVSTASSIGVAGADFWATVYGMLLEEEKDTATILIFPQFQDDFVRFELFHGQLFAELWDITHRVWPMAIIHPKFQFHPDNSYESEQNPVPGIAQSSYVFTHRGPYPAIMLVHSDNPIGQPWLSKTVSAESFEMRAQWMAETSKKLENIGVHWLQEMLDAKNWTALPQLLQMVGGGAM